MIACLFALYLSNHFASRAEAALRDTCPSVGLVSPAAEGTPAPPQPPDLLCCPLVPVPQPLPEATSAASPLVPAPVAAAKISEELLSILILIDPFLIMMFSQQFQPIMVSQGY